jgi:ribosomal protein S18 acetylase RimI-like enzyme
MASSPVPSSGLTVGDLREFRSDVLESLLVEQALYWEKHLRWDFSASKDILLRYINLRNLYGFVLLRDAVPIGYSYFIHENRKALLGDLFISEAHREPSAESMLLSHTLRAAAVFPGVRRIEGQLLTLSGEPPELNVYGHPVRLFLRNFMMLEGLPASRSPTKSVGLMYRGWTDRDLDKTSGLIHRAYQGHVDSLINDQYRSAMGARRFLFNSTQHPGCGLFYRKAARAAFDRVANTACGVCLGSLVLPKVGHITQLCVDPRFRRSGVGRELLGQALDAYREHGCEAVSLTVTASNQQAIELYERIGFQVHKRFPAFVWESY